jgi:hypothetical protein
MLFQRPGWDIHAVSAESDRAGRNAPRATSARQELSSTTSIDPDARRPPAISLNQAAPHQGDDMNAASTPGGEATAG